MILFCSAGTCTRLCWQYIKAAPVILIFITYLCNEGSDELAQVPYEYLIRIALVIFCRHMYETLLTIH